MKAEWRKAAFFAEVAEALGITTGQVFGITPLEDKEGYLALYTPEEGSEPPPASVNDVEAMLFRGAFLVRDKDGILRRHGMTFDIPGLGEKMEQILEEARRLMDEEDVDG